MGIGDLSSEEVRDQFGHHWAGEMERGLVVMEECSRYPDVWGRQIADTLIFYALDLALAQQL